MAKHTVSPTKAVSLFNFSDNDIRVILDDNGDPWFVAKDVAEALEYSYWQPHLVSAVPDEWKGIKPINTLGGVQELLCLSEQGLYLFVIRSDKPKALPFQKWLAGDVVPSIRKTGEYHLLLKALLRPEPAEWERRFPPPFYEALCRLFGWTYTHHTALPNVIGQITRRWVYQVCMPDPVLEEMDARRGSEKLHQWLTEEGAKSIIRQIDAITITARQSTDYRDFDARCGTLFGTKDQQLNLLFPLLKTAPQLPPH